MQRYFAKRCDENGFLYIEGSDVFHIVKVMRMKEQANLYVVFEQKVALARIVSIEEHYVKLLPIKYLELDGELPVNVILACALTKGMKWEVIVQKGTELGANMFVPWQASRSVVQWNEAKKVQKCMRYQKVAIEAARQAHRTFIPQVTQVTTLEDIIKQYATKAAIKLVAYEESSRNGESTNLANACKRLANHRDVLVIFGPEGGLSPQEIALLEESDFICCSLGKRILRAETAPLFVMSVLGYELELNRF